MFSPIDSKKAIDKTQKMKSKLIAMKEACSGLSTLAVTVFLADNMDVKGLAKIYVPSLIAIDGIVVKQASTAFKACAVNSGKVIKMLDTTVLPSLEEHYQASRGLRNQLKKVKDGTSKTLF